MSTSEISEGGLGPPPTRYIHLNIRVRRAMFEALTDEIGCRVMDGEDQIDTIAMIEEILDSWMADRRCHHARG